MTSNVIPLRPPARARASAAWRRARVRCGLSQEPAALAVHRDPRTVRRREACDVDLGLLEAVLSHPKFAEAFLAELATTARRAA